MLTRIVMEKTLKERSCPNRCDAETNPQNTSSYTPNPESMLDQEEVVFVLRYLDKITIAKVSSCEQKQMIEQILFSTIKKLIN